MTNKEYKKALDNHIQHWDYLTQDQVKEVKTELKADKKNGAFSVDGMTDRAVIIPVEHGLVLKSYQTKVCAYIDGEFYKTWEGWSATTMKHINAFRRACNLPTLSKKEWVAMDTVYAIIDMETGEILYEV